MKAYGIVRKIDEQESVLIVMNASEEEIASGHFFDLPVFLEHELKGKTEEQIQEMIE